jgi:hypothetical protein
VVCYFVVRYGVVCYFVVPYGVVCYLVVGYIAAVRAKTIRACPDATGLVTVGCKTSRDWTRCRRVAWGAAPDSKPTSSSASRIP